MQDEEGYRSVLPDNADGYEPVEVFSFEEVFLSIDDDAKIRYGTHENAAGIMRFRIADPAIYAGAMTSATSRLLGKL